MATINISDRYSASKNNVKRKYSPVKYELSPYRKTQTLSVSRKKINHQWFPREFQKFKKETVELEQDSEFNIIEKENKRLKNTIKVMEKEKTMYSTILNYQVSANTFHSDIQELYRQNMQLKKSYHDVVEKNVRLNSRIGFLQEENSKLMKKIIGLKREEPNVPDKLVDKIELLQKYKREIRRLRGDNQSLKNVMADENNYNSKSKWSELQKINNDLLRQNTRLAEQIKEQELIIIAVKKADEEGNKIDKNRRVHLINLVTQNKGMSTKVEKLQQTQKELEKQIGLMRKRICDLERQEYPKSEIGVQCKSDVQQQKAGTDELDFDPPPASQFAELRKVLEVIKFAEGSREQLRNDDYNSFVRYFRTKMAHQNIAPETLLEELGKAEVDSFSERDIRTVLSFKPFCFHPRDQSLFFKRLFQENPGARSFPKQKIMKQFQGLTQRVTNSNQAQQRRAMEVLFNKIEQPSEKQEFERFLDMQVVSGRKLEKQFQKLKIGEEDRQHLRNVLLKGAKSSEEMSLEPLRQSYLSYSLEKGTDRQTFERLSDPPLLLQYPTQQDNFDDLL